MSPRTRPAPVHTLAALLTAGVLLLGACSSGSDDPASGTTTSAGGATTTEAAGPTTTDGTTDPEPGASTTEPDGPTTSEVTPSTGGRAEFVSALADAVSESLQVDDESASTCIAEGWVDIVGYDRIVDAGVEAAELGDGDDDAWAPLEVDEDEADELYAAVGDCDHNFAAAARDQITSGEDAATTACVERVLTDDVIATYVKSSFRAADDDVELGTLLEECEQPDAG